MCTQTMLVNIWWRGIAPKAIKLSSTEFNVLWLRYGVRWHKQAQICTAQYSLQQINSGLAEVRVHFQTPTRPFAIYWDHCWGTPIVLATGIPTFCLLAANVSLAAHTLNKWTLISATIKRAGQAHTARTRRQLRRNTLHTVSYLRNKTHAIIFLNYFSPLLRQVQAP